MAFKDKQKEAEYKSNWQKANRDKNNAAKRRYMAKLTPSELKSYRSKETAGQARRFRDNPVKVRLATIKARAKKQGVAFNLTEEWFLAHFNVCEVTGIELNLETGSPWMVEVDRINAGGDYTMDNCRLVCAIYNRSRMGYSDADVLTMALALEKNSEL